jgi:hypothetical protein
MAGGRPGKNGDFTTGSAPRTSRGNGAGPLCQAFSRGPQQALHGRRIAQTCSSAPLGPMLY